MTCQQSTIQRPCHQNPITSVMTRATNRAKEKITRSIKKAGERKNIIKDLEAWIMTKPERNEENLAKYNKFISDITAVEKDLQKYW